MNIRRGFLLLLMLSVAAAAPAGGQTPATIPDFSGAWNHTSLNGLEATASDDG